MKFPNPFVIGSGPPGTNYKTIARCFDAGWGGVVAKTVSLTDNPVTNVAPRYGQHRFSTDDHAAKRGDTIGFTNIELISDRPLEDWLDDFKRLKEEYPDHILIASIMEQYDKERWQELTRRIAECGVDAFECNFSCPHGHPERNMVRRVASNPAAPTRWCSSDSAHQSVSGAPWARLAQPSASARFAHCGRARRWARIRAWWRRLRAGWWRRPTSLCGRR
jgi:dihydropyrimidine dehydrogenase (NADP+)